MSEVFTDQDVMNEPSDLADHKVPGWMAFGVNILVFAVESAYLLWVVLTDGAEMESFLLLHMGVIILLILWHFWCRRTYKAYLFPTFTLFFVVALGPLGALGTAYATVVRAFFRRGQGPFQSLFAVLFPEESGGRSHQLYEQLTRMDPDVEIDEGIAPLMDVISHGSVRQKQAAIMLMSHHFVPPFTPVLKLALEDPDPSLRTMAATAIASVERAMNEEALELEQDLSYNNDEESLLALAIHFDQYAWCGLLDETHTRMMREKALTFYHKYLERQPRDISAVKEVGRLLFRSGKLEEAVVWFERYREMGESNPHFLSWYLEVLYEQGRFGDMRALIERQRKHLVQADMFPFAVSDTFGLWCRTGGDL